MQNINDFQSFKTEECQETLCPCYKKMTDTKQLPPDFAECPYYHNQQDRRRPPFRDCANLIPAYDCSKPFGFSLHPQKCTNIIEEMYHPAKFKTSACVICEGYYCPNYHSLKERDKWDMILKRNSVQNFVPHMEANKNNIKDLDDSLDLEEEEEKRFDEQIKTNILSRKVIISDESSIEEEDFHILDKLQNPKNKEILSQQQDNVNSIPKEQQKGSLDKDSSISLLYKRLQKHVKKNLELKEPIIESTKNDAQVEKNKTSSDYRGAFDYQQRDRSNSPEPHPFLTILQNKKNQVGIKTTQEKVLKDEGTRILYERNLRRNVGGSLNIQYPQEELKDHRIECISIANNHLSQQMPERRIELLKPYNIETIEAQMKQQKTTDPLQQNGHNSIEDLHLIQLGTRVYYSGEKTSITENMQNEFKQFKTFSIPYLEELIEKYACSFLNSKGGTLYLGITDDGIVLGVRLTRKNLDEISIAFDRKLKNFSPPIRADQYSIKANYVLDKKTQIRIKDYYVIEIEIKQGDPSDLYFTDLKESFIRKQASSILLTPAAIKDEIKARTRRLMAKNLVGLLADSGFEESLRRQSVKDLEEIKKDLEGKIKLINELIEKDKGDYDKHLENLEKGLLSKSEKKS